MSRQGPLRSRGISNDDALRVGHCLASQRSDRTARMAGPKHKTEASKAHENKNPSGHTHDYVTAMNHNVFYTLLYMIVKIGTEREHKSDRGCRRMQQHCGHAP